jgi:hypothetical protein
MSKQRRHLSLHPHISYRLYFWHFYRSTFLFSTLLGLTKLSFGADFSDISYILWIILVFRWDSFFVRNSNSSITKFYSLFSRRYFLFNNIIYHILTNKWHRRVMNILIIISVFVRDRCNRSFYCIVFIIKKLHSKQLNHKSVMRSVLCKVYKVWNFKNWNTLR